MNYTMMGDAVNLAARLEAGAKQFGVYSLVSEAVLEAGFVDKDGQERKVRDLVEARFIDKITVVGHALVPGMATTVQVMMKDSAKYAATGGWGFGRFVDGKPVDIAQHQTCFACHAARVKDRDYVFTRLAP